MEDPTLIQSQKEFWTGSLIFFIMMSLLAVGIVTFFSPLLVITMGGVLFLLNRRRMGQKTIPRIMFSAILLALIVFFVFWVSHGHSDDLSWSNFLNNSWGGYVVASFLCLALGVYYWRTTDQEISKFSQQNNFPDKISSWYGPSLFLFVIGLSFVLQVSGNQIAKALGYCYLPTLPDISQRWFDERGEGVQKIILRPEDFGCGWSFKFQSSEQGVSGPDNPTASDGYSRTIFSRYFNHESGVTANSDIDHHVWVETDLASLSVYEQMPDSIDLATNSPIHVPAINIDPPPDLMKVRCLGYDKDRDSTFCQVIIVRGPVVSSLLFNAANLPHDEYWAFFIRIIQNTDKRVQIYLAETEISR